METVTELCAVLRKYENVQSSYVQAVVIIHIFIQMSVLQNMTLRSNIYMISVNNTSFLSYFKSISEMFTWFQFDFTFILFYFIVQNLADVNSMTSTPFFCRSILTNELKMFQ